MPSNQGEADLERLRATAEGARSVADGHEGVLADAANIESAAEELARLRARQGEAVDHRAEAERLLMLAEGAASITADEIYSHRANAHASLAIAEELRGIRVALEKAPDRYRDALEEELSTAEHRTNHPNTTSEQRPVHENIASRLRAVLEDCR